MRQEQIRRSTRPGRSRPQPQPALELPRSRPTGDGERSDELLRRIDAVLQAGEKTAA